MPRARPLELLLVMIVSGDRRIMADRINSRLVEAVGWLAAVVMSLAAVALIVLTLTGAA